MITSANLSGRAGHITCTTISGPAAGPVTISGCTGGDTGGGSEALAALETGGPIDWTSGSITTTGAPSVSATSAKKCPGYSKVKGATEPAAFKLAGSVTGDSGDGLKVPGTLSGEICLSTSGNLSMLKDFKFT